MKKLLSLLVALFAMANNISAQVYSGTCGINLQWNFDVESRTLFITGTGDMTDYSSQSSIPWYSIYTYISNISIDEGITSVGNYAFCSCSGITTITLPSTLKRIGKFSYCECKYVKTLTIPDSVTLIGYGAFMGCEALEQITLPNTKLKIQESAFSFCKRLESITIPCNTEYVAYNAFANSTRLKTIVWNAIDANGDYSGSPFDNICTQITLFTFGDSVKYIPSNICKGMTRLDSISFPNSLNDIGNSSFEGCTGIRVISIPNSVTTINDKAFTGCSNMRSITLGNSLTSIGKSSFSECSSLKSIIIPDSVAYIGELCFNNCGGMKSVKFLSDVLEIGSSAFLGCSGLDTIYVSDVSSWFNITFADKDSNPLYRANRFVVNGTETNAITVPSNIESIGDYAFYGFTNLSSFVFSSDVSSIGKCAFYSCRFNEIFVPNSVTSIADSAFAYCIKLEDITLPDSLFSFGENVFYGCSKLPVEGDIRYADKFLVRVLDKSQDSYQIKDGTKRICNNAFEECNNVVNIILPNSIERIDSRAFFYCAKLDSVVLSNNLKFIGKEAFGRCNKLKEIRIPSSVEQVGAGAFSPCSSLTKVIISDLTAWCNITFESYSANPCCNAHHLYLGDDEIIDLSIPTNVNSIKDFAFYGCTYLNSVSLSETVTSIESLAFKQCKGLTSVSLSNGLTLIGPSAFSECSALTHIDIPDNVITISRLAFEKCSNLETIIISNGVKKILGNAFQNCTKLKSITIPNSVNKLGSYAFSGCSSLDSVILGDSIKSIEWATFENCSKLDNISLGNSITYIGEYAFRNCKLNNLILPSSISTIGNNAFMSTGIRTVIVKAIEPPVCTSTSFPDAKKIVPLYVPYESIDLYRNANVWKEFYSINALPATVTNNSNLQAETTEERVTLNWPIVENADQYVVDIFKKGTVIKSISFNSSGSIIGYQANSPSIRKAHKNKVDSAGLSYTINGLIMGATYKGIVTAISVENNILYQDSLDFTMKGELFTYSVIFLGLYNDTISVQQVEPNEDAIAPSAPDIEGYHFVGWSNGFTNVQNDVVTRAMYDINKYIIKFVNWDGTELQTLNEIEHGTMPIYSGNTPIRPNDQQYSYSFVGWSPEIAVATQNATYIATYHASQVAEDIKDIRPDETTPSKFFLHGQIFILCGDKAYTSQGQEVRYPNF